MINILAALNEAKRLANDDTHGYSMSQRLGPDYDCSSFIAHILNVGGGNIDPNMSTVTELAELTAAGFIEISINEPAQIGDVYFYDEGGGAHGHTFIIYDHTRYVHASSSKDHPETGDQSQTITDGYDYTGEICFGYLPYDFSRHTWHHLRYSQSLRWIAGNRELTETERQNNAQIIYYWFSNRGYSLNAIAAMLGNMEFESYLCPDKWEDAYPPYTTGGYGLIQWTPYTVYSSQYTDWNTNHDNQLDFINTGDVVNYITTASYPITWNEFKTSTADIDYLTKTYFYNRERGTWSSLRTTYALKWYEYFSGPTPPPPHPPVPGEDLPIWLMIKIKNKNNGGC